MGGRRDWHMRDVRWHPRNGWEPNWLHGTRRLPRLAIPICRRLADRERTRLPGPARQLHGNVDVAAVSGGGLVANDSARRATASDVALRKDRARGMRSRRLL